jgi:mono/diheme cytochrome c family protein
MEDGSGLEGNIPPLAQADYLADHQDQLACIIRYGQQDSIQVNGVTYYNAMPGVPQLSDFEIANVINYINHSWGNDLGYIQIDEVRASLERCDPENSSNLSNE